MHAHTQTLLLIVFPLFIQIVDLKLGLIITKLQANDLSNFAP